MNGFYGLVFACFVVSTLQLASSMPTKKAMMDNGSMKGNGKQQGSPAGNKMPSTMSPSSAPSGEDEDDSMESESKEADQIGEGAKNCTMSGMDMSAQKNMANGGMKGGSTASPTKAMMNNGNMGMRMTKANCTDRPMGGTRRGGGNNMKPSTMMMNEGGKMQSPMTTPKGRQN